MTTFNPYFERKRKPAAVPAHYDKWSPKDLEEVRRRRANGESRADIARAMGRTEKAVKHKLLKKGMQ
jgi:DNA-binding NarL/FixJ family response regulator